MYVIKKTDQGGGFLAPSGRKETYTYDVSEARVFRSLEKANNEKCQLNEIVVDIESILYVE